MRKSTTQIQHCKTIHIDGGPDRIRIGDLLHVKQPVKLLSEKNLRQEYGALMTDFYDFQIVDLKRGERIAKEKVWYIEKFLKATTKSHSELSREDVRGYLKGLNGAGTATYSNTLKSFKVFFRDFLNKPDIVKTFRFPKQSYKPKNIPSKEALKKFYEALSSLKKLSHDFFVSPE